ncbi:MAG: EscU/YscU/HrcU family type III secretion system export apparatus switch protein [Bacillota bacterium]
MMTEKRKEAAAIRYDAQAAAAPVVVAAGKGEIAERILALAAQNGIPIHQDEELAKVLVNLPIGEEIPPELYLLVARILVCVLRMDKAAAKGL